MSAFFVGNKSINKLATTIHLFFPEVVEKLNVKTTQELAVLLYELNREALIQRYEDGEQMVDEFEFKPEEYGYFNLQVDKDRAQFFMSISCFLYQCAEGNVPERVEYKVLEELERELAWKIARDWAEKQGARWE